MFHHGESSIVCCQAPSRLALLCFGPCDAGAQLGIIFDTDVDRSAVVDGDGTPINSNRFIALMAAIVLQVRRRAVSIGGSGSRAKWWWQFPRTPGVSSAPRLHCSWSEHTASSMHDASVPSTLLLSEKGTTLSEELTDSCCLASLLAGSPRQHCRHGQRHQ